MTRNGAIKTILFNLAIALLLIFFYHPNLVGLSLSASSTFKTTCAITFLPFLLIICFVVNRKLIKNDGSESTKNKNELINELGRHRTNKLFSKRIILAIQQLETFEKRKTVFKNVLLHNFKEDNFYHSFSDLISNAETSIQDNCQIILNTITTFNYDEYQRLRSDDNTYSKDIIQKKKLQYDEYFNEVSDRINQNANLLVELDNLILEVNRINNSDSKNELNGLLDMVAAMKQLHFGTNAEMSDLENKYNDK